MFDKDCSYRKIPDSIKEKRQRLSGDSMPLFFLKIIVQMHDSVLKTSCF